VEDEDMTQTEVEPVIMEEEVEEIKGRVRKENERNVKYKWKKERG
jgi:hypothetical protein